MKIKPDGAYRIIDGNIETVVTEYVRGAYREPEREADGTPVYLDPIPGPRPEGDDWFWSNMTYDWSRTVWRRTWFQVGKLAQTICVEDHSPDAMRSGRTNPEYSIIRGLDGVEGNSNPNLRRFHGWRGITNDQAVYACGVRRILGAVISRRGKLILRLGQPLAHYDD